jgi:hypothetical protein
MLGIKDSHQSDLHTTNMPAAILTRSATKKLSSLLTTFKVPNFSSWLPLYYKSSIFADNSPCSSFDFFNFPDPTHGLVNYVDGATAFSTGLAGVDTDGVVHLRVDDTTVLQPGENRNSVRIQTKKRYNGGLFIFDVIHMPGGCSMWPAGETRIVLKVCNMFKTPLS